MKRCLAAAWLLALVLFAKAGAAVVDLPLLVLQPLEPPSRIALQSMDIRVDLRQPTRPALASVHVEAELYNPDLGPQQVQVMLTSPDSPVELHWDGRLLGSERIMTAAPADSGLQLVPVQVTNLILMAGQKGHLVADLYYQARATDQGWEIPLQLPQRSAWAQLGECRLHMQMPVSLTPAPSGLALSPDAQGAYTARLGPYHPRRVVLLAAWRGPDAATLVGGMLTCGAVLATLLGMWASPRSAPGGLLLAVAAALGWGFAALPSMATRFSLDWALPPVPWERVGPALVWVSAALVLAAVGTAQRLGLTRARTYPKNEIQAEN